ncbi:hypothetical protein ACFWWT_28620 [Streptomyces sp. NPDC058676]|uniref:hypothetical protein n=1 Tax=unclassified Streptomyces TaxID=2593676 RepID=UPI003656F358
MMEELKNLRHDSVRRFLERWYGVDRVGDTVAFPEMSGIPRELVEWHEAAASTGVDVTFQDYPIAPAELTRSGDGMIVFWVENQNGYYWAFDPDLAEHQVFVKESASDVWRDTGVTLDRFLLHCTVHEAIVGAESKFSAVVPESALQGALAAFSALPFSPPANDSPSARLLCSANALARVAPPPVGYAPEGERSWMLTIATVSGADVQEYRKDLESYNPTEVGRPQLIEVPIDDLPF